MIFLIEYVGPSQFQYTDKQVKIINDIIDLLSSVYRKRVTDLQTLKPLFIPPSKKYMDEHDPSEAIRSAEIINLFEQNLIYSKDLSNIFINPSPFL